MNTRIVDAKPYSELTREERKLRRKETAELMSGAQGIIDKLIGVDRTHDDKPEDNRKKRQARINPSGHPTTTVLIAGERVAVDTAILPLIRAVNSLPGIVTTNCCQDGYVQFKDDGDSPTGVAILQQLLALLSPLAKRLKKKEDLYVAQNGLRHGSVGYDLHFAIEIGNHYCIRWLPNSYPHVLRAVRQLVRSMKA